MEIDDETIHETHTSTQKYTTFEMEIDDETIHETHPLTSPSKSFPR